MKMINKYGWLIISLLIGLGVVIIYGMYKNQNSNVAMTGDEVIRYVAIGDSYTIGNGVDPSQRWPNLLTKHLKEEGINVELVANPAVSGYTTQDATQIEIPKVVPLKPDLVTVLIGANDSFRDDSVEDYRRDLDNLIDQVEKILTDPDQIVLVTIPDYTVSPAAQDSEPVVRLQNQNLIREYNDVIKTVALERNLKVADIFPVSQTMTGLEDYINDGLHPSALGYQKWEAVILEEVKSLIQK